MSPYLTTMVVGLLIALVVGALAAVATPWIARKDKVNSDVAIRGGLVGGAIVAVCCALAYVAYTSGYWGDHTSQCPGVTDPAQDAAQRALAITCGNTQVTFDEMSHSAHDVQFLDIEVNGRAAAGGPLAAIYPEMNAHRNDPSELAAGRIVAKVWVNESDAAGYPKLGFGPGINYIWIDANNPPQGQVRRVDTTEFPGDTIPGFGLRDDPEGGVTAVRGRYRAVIIPTAQNFPVRILPVDYYDHRRAPLYTRRNQAQANWVFWPNDIGSWMDCTKYGCCSVGDE